MTSHNVQLTAKQRQVLTFSNNACVLAGAGSGKTMTLVELLIQLLENPPSPLETLELPQILALTYTEKAAREMRNRIREKLNLSIAEADSGRKSFWLRQRRLLDRSSISTIHSFCLQVLRTEGLSMGLDPDFQIIGDDPDFINESLRRILLDWIDAEDSDLLELLEFFPWLSRGRAKGVDFLLGVINDYSRTFGRIPKPSSSEGFDIENIINELIWAADLIDELVESGKIKSDKIYYHTVTAFSRRIRALTTEPNLETLFSAGSELLSMIKGNWHAAKSARDRALAALEELNAENACRLAGPLQEKLIRLSARMDQAMEEIKEQRKALDFDDLLLNTREILKGNLDVRRRLKSRYKILMIDEFQDTNRLQADIIALLLEPESKEQEIGKIGEVGSGSKTYLDVLEREDKRLVVFGDPKQSIYRFRGAEVDVFHSLRNSLTDGSGCVISLDTNFRSGKKLVDFFNAFFATAMCSTKGVELNFSEDDIQNSHRPNNGSGPAVWVSHIDPEPTMAQTRESEAEFIAEYIQMALRGDIKIRVGHDGRPPRLKDFAVLMRRFTHLKAYETAFKRHAISYYTVRGQGFYQCTEVRDLINVLFFLEELNEGPALLGLLRSPLVGVSDETLTRLVWPNPGSGRKNLASYFDDGNQEWPPGLPANERDMLIKAKRWLSELIRQAGHAFPADLVEKAVEASDYGAVLLGQPQGTQKLVNVQKLIEDIRQISSGALYLPGEAARWLRTRLESRIDDPEAQLDGEDAQVVRIMTIHQAKGLQFPIVFVPDAGQPPRWNNAPIVFGNNDCLSLKFRHPETLDRQIPKQYRQFQECDRRSERSEYMRLLYVAATRAEDHLVFSGSPSKNDDEESWLAQLDQFSLSRPDLLGRFKPATGGRQQDLFDYKILPDEEIRNEAADPDQADRVDRIIRRLQKQESPIPRIITLPVTHVVQYLFCPHQYYLEHILNLPTDSLPGDEQPATNKQQTSGELPAREKGIIFHHLMETLDLRDLPNTEKLSHEAELRAAAEHWKISRHEAEQLAASVKRFLDHPWGKDLIKARENIIQREAPFWFKFEPREQMSSHLILTGEIDLFYILADGPARLIDFKFSQAKEIYRYAPQVKIYSLAMVRSGLSRQLEAGLFFSNEYSQEAVPIPLDQNWQEDIESKLELAAKGLSELFRTHTKPPKKGTHSCPDSGCHYKYICNNI